jgi:catechol 2,3-dioxygenase-like lactoylglutathione lyase family enzyme
VAVARATALDHIVLVVTDPEATIRFYAGLLGLSAREERPGKWSLHAGSQKISLQRFGHAPTIAHNTLPGTGNLCFLIDGPLDDAVAALAEAGVAAISAAEIRDGATGPIRSVHLRDPDGNLVEIGEPLDTGPEPA